MRYAALILALAAAWTPVRAGDCTTGLVAAVSLENLEAHVGQLAFVRSTPQSQAQASAYIRAQLESYGYEVVIDPVQTSENLIVRRPGSATTQQRFVIGAHFDTVPGSPGADDNATGVAAVLEIARLLAGYQPEKTVELVAYALEEIGKVGSTQHAAALSATGVDVIGMISFDMIGKTCAVPGCQTAFADQPGCVDFEPENVNVGDFIFAGTKSGTPFMAADFVAAAAQYVPELPVTSALIAPICQGQAAFQRSDHAPFWAQGYPAMILTDSAEGRNPDYHGSGDVPSTVDFGFVRAVTRTALAQAVGAAGGTCGGAGPICGDGAINAAGEECDGADLGGATCESLGLGVGTVSCDAACKLVTTGCAQPPPDVQSLERTDKQN